ncbi:hypothetical protein ACIBKX_17845 [Streptomyces sp. NPDC050658]|uniref:hypothetical protein n=1 Tax=unclassified Streptomyces TaxID=2593676 RepID=UPI0034457370
MGLGLLLFGLVFTHAASPDATSGHLAVDSGIAAPGVPGGHHQDHEQQHTVEECALGQPPQGPDVDMPCLSPLDSDQRAGASLLTRAHAVAGRDFVVPIAHAADSTILRI